MVSLFSKDRIIRLLRELNWISIINEFIGTLIVIFVSSCVVVVTRKSELETLDYVSESRTVNIALATGLSYSVVYFSLKRLPLLHLNPIVTLCAILTKKIAILQGLFYFLAQFLGGLTSSLLVLAIANDDPTLGSPDIGNGVSQFQAMIMEAILSFLYIFVMYSVTFDVLLDSKMAPLAIGFVFVTNVLIGYQISGACMNPIRAFSTTLLIGKSHYWAIQWIYWVGPLIGGAIAICLFEFVLKTKAEENAIIYSQIQ
eukprot:TRINITY_DN14565_c0_g1_i1.p1 TRINITY_DN14565_c0_g1~~TRINITY_DN14565_c0_g1_i1.p1  ORF type:complete len:257 (-),score=39.08 TRINITY_DN14565_c0_g1_i1:33-803(-)